MHTDEPHSILDMIHGPDALKRNGVIEGIISWVEVSLIASTAGILFNLGLRWAVDLQKHNNRSGHKTTGLLAGIGNVDEAEERREWTPSSPLPPQPGGASHCDVFDSAW